MKNRLFALILCGLLTAQVAACGGSSSTGTDATASSGGADTTTSGETTGETSGVPAGTDLDGETINIWYTTTATSVAETFVDLNPEQTGDMLDDAIYNMNVAIEDKLNVNLNYVNSNTPTSDTGSVVRTQLLADDTSFDLYHVVQWNASVLAAEGLYLNVADAPYISFDMPWWDSGYMKEMTIGENKMYALVGDYAVDRTRCLNCIYYNKEMYNDFYKDPDGLYEEVLNKKWTWDRLREICAAVYSDLNNDGVMDTEDRLGMVHNDYNNIDGFWYGAGAIATERDKKDVPQVVLNSEHCVDVAQSLLELVFESEGILNTGAEYTQDVENRTKFENGKYMFLPGFFYTSEAMREMKADFGIVPFPLYDENQDGYKSIVHDIMRMMVVPYNCQKFDAVCAVLEEMAFLGYKDVLPDYYNVLMKNKYARDEASATMIDIIRDNCAVDIAYIYGFNQLGTLSRMMVQKNPNWASTYAEYYPAGQVEIDKLVDKFTEVE